MDERPWYAGFFDDDYLRIFSPLLLDERTAAEVNGVVERLGLSPGARLLDLQELANREALVRGWHDSEVLHTDDGLMVVQERALDLRRGREQVRYTLLHPDGRRTTREHAIRLYALTELAAMLDRAGLALGEVWGDLDGGPLELDSPFVVTLSGRSGVGIS